MTISQPIDFDERQREREGADVSALMSTYAGETASNLKDSLESVFAQTTPPDQLVLVVDGPVDERQEQVIAQYARDPRIANVILLRLPSSGGLARAMNAGMGHCFGKYVMRADSDDLCDPRRLELQLDYFKTHPDVDLVASWCTEFSNDGRAEVLKVFPTQHDSLAQSLRRRNVVPHASVMIRKETLARIGGYRPDFGMLEDYDLFVRLLASGAKFHAIPKVLLRARTSIEQRQRRGGLRYCWNEIRFRVSCFWLGFLNMAELLITTSLYVGFRLIGGSLRARLYRFVRTSSVT